MTGTSIGFGYLVGLFGLVTAGAAVPVIPTGALVSVGGALAERDNVALVVLVVAFGGAGAYVGDLGTYAVLRFVVRRFADNEGRVGRWLGRQRRGQALERFRRQMAQHELRTLLLSRLVPGGQIPVLVAAAVDGYPWRRYAVADIAAAMLWSAMYAATGIAGRAIFPKQWEGIAAGIGLVLLISLASNLWTRRHRSAADREAGGARPADVTP